MKNRYLSLIILFFFTLIGPASGFATIANQASLGEKLEKNLFNVVTEKNWDKLNRMLSPEFQSINADGIRNREQAIAYIKSLNFTNYNFSNFNTTENSAKTLLVVTYEMTYTETTGSMPESGKKIKNLSVWKKIHGNWQWVAHAVID